MRCVNRVYFASLINHTHGGGVGAESGWHKAVEEVKEGAHEFADDTAAAGMMQCVLLCVLLCALRCNSGGEQCVAVC